jgi:hypothetical protein
MWASCRSSRRLCDLLRYTSRPDSSAVRSCLCPGPCHLYKMAASGGCRARPPRIMVVRLASMIHGGADLSWQGLVRRLWAPFPGSGLTVARVAGGSTDPGCSFLDRRGGLALVRVPAAARRCGPRRSRCQRPRAIWPGC